MKRNSNEIVNHQNKKVKQLDSIVLCFNLLNGRGRKRNENKAKKMCLRICKKEENLFALSLKHLKGWECEKNEEKSFQYLSEYVKKMESKEIKDKEKAMAFNLMASFHEQAIYVEKNIEKAIQFYLKAIELGDTQAMNNLAFIYFVGIDVEKDIPKVIELYLKAIELEDSDSMYNLAFMYEQGNGAEKNVRKAIELYLKSVELGNTKSMNNLAVIYNQGFFVEKDIPKAIELYQKAIELEDSTAMYCLGSMYANGFDVKKDIPKAIELIHRSLKSGNFFATHYLANYYLSVKDYVNAAQYYFSYFKFMERNENEKSITKIVLVQVLSTKFVEWNIDYHLFWNSKDILIKKIETILLISKNRNESKNKSNFLVKGISMNIIKFLCHFTQI